LAHKPAKTFFHGEETVIYSGHVFPTQKELKSRSGESCASPAVGRNKTLEQMALNSSHRVAPSLQVEKAV
jgi:hypothetical protein